MYLVVSEYVYILPISEAIKKKPKPAPEKKSKSYRYCGLICAQIKDEPQIYPNSMMILKFSHSVNIFIVSEAEVITEKVKLAPVKKGMNISEIILYTVFFSV